MASSGVITMNMNHTLAVTADELFNPSGDWAGYLYYATYDNILDLTFSGDYSSGTVSGLIEYKLDRLNLLKIGSCGWPMIHLY